MKAIRHVFAAAIGAGAIVAFSVGQAQSQAQVMPLPMLCMDRADAMESINKHGETNTSRGMSGQILVQVWSEPGGKFTITVRHPDAPDKLCGVVAGEYWHEVSE